MADKEKLMEAARLIIEAIGEDINREGLIETPERIAKMYEEVFSGINKTAEEHLSKCFTAPSDDIVIEKDITYYSMCEHHFVPFFGKVHIAYIPNGKVAGLSKLARAVDVYSKKPQLQERLTAEIVDSIMEYLGAKGALVMVEGEHMCMTMRGVKKPGTKTITTAYRGCFKDDNELRREALGLIRG